MAQPHDDAGVALGHQKTRTLRQQTLTFTFMLGLGIGLAVMATHAQAQNASPLLADQEQRRAQDRERALRDIEQALENFKRVPTAQADIAISPAQDGDAQLGESDLRISYKHGFLFRVALSADDSGSKPSP